MVRNYKARNPIDPGSKLSAQQTLDIIRHLIAGARGALIAKMENVSENTVSSVSAKFRNKLRTSKELRQGCFEPFYVTHNMSKEFYTWLIDLPDEESDFYERAGRCALNCSSEFKNNAQTWANFIRKRNVRLLNVGQTQSFINSAYTDRSMILRIKCQNCPASDSGPTDKVQFYNFMGHYLRERNLRIQNAKDHFLLCALNYALHRIVMFRIGISWSSDEIHFPGEATWEELRVKFAEQMQADSFTLVGYFLQFLEDDPL